MNGLHQSMGDNDEIIKEFLIESNENLDRLDRDLVNLEKHPTSNEILSTVFRTIHTIKGATGFLGFPRLESVAHTGESLLSRLRDKAIRLTPEVISGLLAMVDAVREMLAAIESTGRDGDRDYTLLIETLKRLQGGPSADGDCKKESAIKGGESLIPLGQILLNSGRVTTMELEAALKAQQAGDRRRVGEILVEQGIIAPLAVSAAIEEQKQTSPLSANTIRVDVGHLDKLMNLVGELVLVRNQIMQFRAAHRDAALRSASQRLNLITTELQEGVIKMRMQPINNIWSMFPRVVRDLAMACGKQARVEMEGRETELDRTILEAIKDPLIHLVRNAVDHGIEGPGMRIAKGKPPEGLISLRAYYEGGQVNIEVSDDGAGIEIERVKLKGIERGLISEDQAASMPGEEALDLIFLPGFSTAAKITRVSGRGVGMDVVKTNIEKTGGTVDVESKPGIGSTLRIKIPLNLTPIPTLAVASGSEHRGR